MGVKLGINCKSEINIAIIGLAGVGKSSLINAILGNNACKTGPTETTFEMRKYDHPNKTYSKFWDVPGAGTINHPIKTYFKDKLLFLMDYLIVVVESRLKEV